MTTDPILLAVDHDAEVVPAVRFATQELRRLLQVTTGRRVMVLDAAHPRPGTLTLALDPALADDPLTDTIAIDTTGDTGTIAGSNPRSVLIAVYRFATELGCRFVRPGPDGELLPAIDLAATTVQVRERAAYQHRGVCIEGASSVTNLVDLIDWLPKLGMNSYFIQFDSPYVFLRSWYQRRNDPAEDAPSYPNDATVAAAHAAVIAELERRDLVHHAVGHGWTSAAIDVPSTGWDTVTGAQFDASLVAEVDGVRELWKGVPLNTELCYSNPRARTAVAKEIADHAVAHPEIDVLHVWLSDGSNNHCECETCRELRPADWYVRMLNEVADLLRTAGSTTRIAFLAYHQLLWPPVAERFTDPDRFVFMYAPIRRDHRRALVDAGTPTVPPYQGNQSIAPTTNEDYLGLLQAWREWFDGSSFDFDYHLMWQHLYDPAQLVMARTLHRDAQTLGDIGLDGLISCQSQKPLLPDGFAMVIMAQTLWDRTIDFDDAWQKHLAATYGPDGGLVGEHLQWLSDRVAEWGLSHLGRDGEITPSSVGPVRERLAEVAALAAQHGAQPHPVWSSSWQQLAAQAAIWTSLCDVWDAVAAGDRDQVFAAWQHTRATVWQRQDEHQSVIDAGNFCQTIERRLDRLFPAA